MPERSPDRPARRRTLAARVAAWRPRSGLLCASTAALALVLAWALVSGKPASAPAASRAAASSLLPDISLVRLDGTASRLRALHPDKIIVLNIWATWCPPCRAELPSLQQLNEALDAERFAVVGISVDEDPDFVREYLNDIGIDFANYIAADNRGMPADLEIDSFPQTLLVRADGSLAQRVVGPRDWAAPDQRRRIEALWPATPAW